ncbi:hypothetical protein MKY15_15650 [Sporosarcina sp. FSL K6-1540]|uniref:hypothetical protein n=1 Tax=Sporosarcina sp. FSL K6-1540 TaxID=2921555 RepID=UPI003159B83D
MGYSVGGNFDQENWDKFMELLEYFRENSFYGHVSNNEALKICVDHTYKTLRTFEEMIEENVHLKSEICELKKMVGELDRREEERIIETKAVIVGLTNIIK